MLKKIKSKTILQDVSVNMGRASSKYLTEDTLVPVISMLSNTQVNTRHAYRISAAACGKHSLINA